MTSIKLMVSGAEAHAEVEGILTAGMVGIPVTIVCDESWDNLTKNLVCKSGQTARAIVNVGTEATVAPEVMISRQSLVLGLEGRNEEGTVVIPTVWAYCGRILESAEVQADPSAGSSLPVWAQIASRIGEMDRLRTKAKDNIVDAVNEAVRIAGGEPDPDVVAVAVMAYLEENPPQVTEVDPTVPAWAKQPEKPVYTAAEVGALPASYCPPEAPVDSVNGQTGAVQLTASDVGALPASYQAPVSAVNGYTGSVVLIASDVGALPDDGGRLTGPLSLDGDLILTEGVHYGTELPEPGTPGRLFFKVVS